MTIEKTFRALVIQIQRLQEVLEALNTTVEEDRPRRNDVVVASNLGDALLAVQGLLEESRAAADEACQAVAAHPLDTDHARRALTTCQERFHRFAYQFSLELASYERIADLTSIAQERGRAWAGWVRVVKQGLTQCQALIEEGREALFLCWQELAERFGATSVSIHNTTIGQQLSTPELVDRDFIREGVT